MRKTFCGITFQIAERKDFNMICHMDFVIKSLKIDFPSVIYDTYGLNIICLFHFNLANHIKL